LRENGFEVDVKATNNLEEITLKAGVPEQLEGCHTMFVDGYVVVGHVSADVVRKLSTEHPPLVGIAIPGMPSGGAGHGWPKSWPGLNLRGEQGRGPHGVCRRVAIAWNTELKGAVKAQAELASVEAYFYEGQLKLPGSKQNAPRPDSSTARQIAPG
jgi:Protein of unknown function, DUF